MAAERRLSVDWPACKGHGLCAELVPELVTLDEWGYPILADLAVTRGVQSHAQRAVAACPTLALMLVETPTPVVAAPKLGAADPISGAIRAATAPGGVPRRSAPTTPAAPIAPEPEPEPPLRRRRTEPSTRRPEPAQHRPEPSTRRPEPSMRQPEPAQRRPEASTQQPEPAGRQPEPARRRRDPEPARRRRSPEPASPTPEPGSGTPDPGRRGPAPADDPITGAIQAVTGRKAGQRRTPPTGMARHATPAYGHPALIPEAEPYEPGDSFFDDYQPREAYESKQPSTRRQARQEQKPLTRREARRQR